jgi:hypothetical protein
LLPDLGEHLAAGAQDLAVLALDLHLEDFVGLLLGRDPPAAPSLGLHLLKETAAGSA